MDLTSGGAKSNTKKRTREPDEGEDFLPLSDDDLSLDLSVEMEYTELEKIANGSNLRKQAVTTPKKKMRTEEVTIPAIPCSHSKSYHDINEKDILEVRNNLLHWYDEVSNSHERISSRSTKS